jgi:hypothetical protein
MALSYSSNLLNNTCRNFFFQTACLFRNLLRKNENCLDWRKALIPAEGSNIAVICKLKDMFRTIPFCSIPMCTATYTLNNSLEPVIQEIEPLPCSPNVHYRIYKSQHWTLSRDILLYSTICHCFCKIVFNIIPCRNEFSECI